MRKTFGKIKEFLFFSLVGRYWGFIFGLAVSMAVFTARHFSFWCLGFTAFFVLFHLSDFRQFIADKNWFAVTGRFIALFSITSFIVSFFVLIFGGYESLDIFDIFGFLIVMPVSMIVATLGTLLKQYGNQTRFYQELEKIVDGLHVLGVLWKY